MADHYDLIAAGADFGVGVEQGPEIRIAAEVEVLEADLARGEASGAKAGLPSISHCCVCRRIIRSMSTNNHPPAEPEVFRLRPPQRGLIAIDESQNHGASRQLS